MGDGVVLESGTHHELLADVNGPYSRLVQAQRLRGGNAHEDGDDDEDDEKIGTSEAHAIEKEAAEEVPLGRSNTGRSLASDLIAQKNQEKEGIKEKEYSMPYLFRRMARINRSSRYKYVYGTIAACSAYLSLSAFWL